MIVPFVIALTNVCGEDAPAPASPTLQLITELPPEVDTFVIVKLFPKVGSVLEGPACSPGVPL